MSGHGPFKGFPEIGLTPQQPLVSPGFSGNDRGTGSLAHRLEQRRYNHLGEHTPQLSRVSNPYYSELQQEHANELLQSRVRYHRDTYQQSAEPSPAPQSDLRGMFDKAKKYAGFWSQQPQQQQQQQRPHTNAGQRAKMTRERALHIMRLPAGSNPANGVKKAFRNAVLKYHPDKTTADRKEVAAVKAKKYKKIHKAYNVLINSHADVHDTSDYSDDDGMAKIGGNNTIKRRHKKHKLAKKTRGKKHSNRRNKTRGKTYRKTRKNTTKRR